MATEAHTRTALPRWSLAVLSALHAPVLAWAAVELPWRDWTLFAIVTAVLAALHVATAVLAALRHRALALVWRAQSALAIGYLGYLAWGLLSSAWYIGSTYSGLGGGVAAALLAVFGLVVLVTLPLACWGLAATGGVRVRRSGAAATALVMLLAAGRLYMLGRQANGTELADEAATSAFEANVHIDTELKAGAPSLLITAPAACSEPLDAAHLTLVVTFASQPTGRATTRCLQAGDAATLARQLAELISAEVLRAPIKLDLITRHASLAGDGLLAALSLRPGLDGVCREDDAGVRCLMPWQLVALDAFNRHQLIASVPDARLGASIEALREALGASHDASLHRIATKSFLIDAGGALVPLGRSPRQQADVNEQEVRDAAALAQIYIARAQNRDGRFNYLFDPFSGAVEQEPFSVARQAGTTLALCELGTSGRSTTVIVQRSLAFLSRLERRFGEGGRLGVLRYPVDSRDPMERIGASGLALSAFLRCRTIVGDRYDATIGRLARLVLGQQLPDGSFSHRVSLAEASAVPGAGSLFVDGQLVLALLLLEEAAGDEDGVLPARAQAHDAAERAMRFFGERYWQVFIRSFLFMEENWHCTAAAAALRHHRNEAYEQLCLDYVSFKRRIVHDTHSGVHDDFLGGYGFGNLVPPHNGVTAGLGEALSAAILIQRARGIDTSSNEALLRDALGFLLRNQWRQETCFACSGRRVAGGFSEHMASPRIRIDYVQHAWAAFGHGARALGFSWAAELPVQRTDG